MLLNISITNQGILKLNVKVASLKEAQADMQEENSNLIWYLGGTNGEERWDWHGQLNCDKRFGWFDDPVYCADAD